MPQLLIQPIKWANHQLFLLDQRLLPAQETYLTFTSAPEVADAITCMVVRGAPAIGISAAYAGALSALNHQNLDVVAWREAVEADLQCLAASRPTAVNLFWAIQQMRHLLADCKTTDPSSFVHLAESIHQNDIEANRIMSRLGAEQITEGSRVITHCNAGALATGGIGTALGVIGLASRDKRIDQVYASETRPWFQGSRLTAWELAKQSIPTTLVCEGAVASLMRSETIDWVIVGADRIAANGDVANKIGTYSLAVLAKQHAVKVMVVAPLATIDLDTVDGTAIPIEFRDENELLYYAEQRVAAAEAGAWNPVFDVTPAACIDVIVTEKGVVTTPNAEKIRHLFQASQ